MASKNNIKQAVLELETGFNTLDVRVFALRLLEEVSEDERYRNTFAYNLAFTEAVDFLEQASTELKQNYDYLCRAITSRPRKVVVRVHNGTSKCNTASEHGALDRRPARARLCYKKVKSRG